MIASEGVGHIIRHHRRRQGLGFRNVELCSISTRVRIYPYDICTAYCYVKTAVSIRLLRALFLAFCSFRRIPGFIWQSRRRVLTAIYTLRSPVYLSIFAYPFSKLYTL
jgi:hypothetical protein